ETKKQCITEENRSELYHVLQDINLLNTFKPAEKDEIQVMTYHKSKGLEFDVVFLMDCYKYILPKERQDRYDNLEADENLHYVGLTRGKKAVYILIGTERYRVHRSDYISAIESIFLSRNGLAKLRRYEDWN
ncbi:ATP-dependent helicase, partial [Enterococcus faecium]|nr:ATP-dependent helicase [Enterococcus faecium]